VEVCASILSTIGDTPMRKTWIMNRANLNHALVTKHLDRLLMCGFLAQTKTSEAYELTDEGRSFLSEYDRFRRLEQTLLQTGIKEQDYFED
jgi:predicted transcriptional regulator